MWSQSAQGAKCRGVHDRVVVGYQCAEEIVFTGYQLADTAALEAEGVRDLACNGDVLGREQFAGHGDRVRVVGSG